MTDMQLQYAIQRNLKSDPIVNPAQIGVAVIDGIVLLSGYVNSRAEKLAIEKAAKSIDAVNAWAEEIEIRSSGCNADLEIAARAEEAIARHLPKSWERIKIKVECGWITLEGRVDHEYEKKAAEVFVGKLSGVKGVTSQIKVASNVSPGEIEGRVQCALKGIPGLVGPITASCIGNKIVLNGLVGVHGERTEAERVARSLAGNQEIENLIMVGF